MISMIVTAHCKNGCVMFQETNKLQLDDLPPTSVGVLETEKRRDAAADWKRLFTVVQLIRTDT